MLGGKLRRDVLEHEIFGLFARSQSLAVDRLNLEAVIPAFHCCVVVTMTLAAHAGDQVVRLRAYLDEKCAITDLDPYDHDVIENGRQLYSEESYNCAMAAAHEGLLCLDVMTQQFLHRSRR